MEGSDKVKFYIKSMVIMVSCMICSEVAVIRGNTKLAALFLVLCLINYVVLVNHKVKD